jgi:hypothetical protein
LIFLHSTVLLTTWGRRLYFPFGKKRATDFYRS